MPQNFERKYLNLAVNIPQGAVINVTITKASGTAKVSSIVLGIVSEFGTATTGTGRALKSRSFKKTEGTLTSLLRRTSAAKVPFKVTLTDYQGDAFWRMVEDIDGLAAVFSGPDNHPEYSVYGFISSAQGVAHGVGISKVSLEVETL